MRGDKLKQFREEKGWTQTRLAKELGVDRTYINMIENGRKEPSIRYLERIASILGKNLKDFF